MTVNFLSVLFFGLILGMKHATEPDHVIAVSTIASRTKALKKSSLTGVYWGIGHTLTLLVIGMVVIGFKTTISETVSMTLELFVGFMLVLLGILSFRPNQQKSVHKQNKDYTHVKSLIIGFIHGLAGSAAMVLLTMTTVENYFQAFLYICIFGVGTIIGMFCFTTIIGLPFVFGNRMKKFVPFIYGIAGVISILYGIYYIYEIIIKDGLLDLIYY
ncbi:urease accessory protein UreH [Bacillus alveayuensis]|uniref:HoxN/HupN/NixA family nickel/cobalt transporter n=1 Tax=Aeribacillus alveayuensis TaxID=279215 RepID=UPI0005CCE2D7|nr:urease accessory protein UreH [Bacillus alveayuensis]